MTTVWLLAMMVEEFGLDYDATTIDQQKQLVEIHQPDGRNDALQQIEHGLLSVLGAYESLGRLYRGIIVPTIRQYVLLGDGSTQTDNAVYDRNDKSAIADDRLVFTEVNPGRELRAAAGLAASSRVLKEYSPELSTRALAAAREIFRVANAAEAAPADTRVFALAELYLATGENAYLDAIVGMEQEISKEIEKTGWVIGRVMPQVKNPAFIAAVSGAVKKHQRKVNEQVLATPYGVPYDLISGAQGGASSALAWSSTCSTRPGPNTAIFHRAECTELHTGCAPG